MNEISADTTELLEAAVTAAEFTDELSVNAGEIMHRLAGEKLHQ